MNIQVTAQKALRSLEIIRELLDKRDVLLDGNARRLFLIEVALLGEILVEFRDADDDLLSKLKNIRSTLYPKSAPPKYCLLHDLIGLRNISLKCCCYEWHIGTHTELDKIIYIFQNSAELTELHQHLHQLESVRQDVSTVSSRERRRRLKPQVDSSREQIYKRYQCNAADHFIIIMKEIDDLFDYLHTYVLTEEDKDGLHMTVSPERDVTALEMLFGTALISYLTRGDKETEIHKKIIGCCIINILQMIQSLGQVLLQEFQGDAFQIENWISKLSGSEAGTAAEAKIIYVMGLDSTRAGRHFINIVAKDKIDEIVDHVLCVSGIYPICCRGLECVLTEKCSPNFFVRISPGHLLFQPIQPKEKCEEGAPSFMCQREYRGREIHAAMLGMIGNKSRIQVYKIPMTEEQFIEFLNQEPERQELQRSGMLNIVILRVHGNHWVTLLIDNRVGGERQIVYIDPIKHPTGNPLNSGTRDILERSFKGMTIKISDSEFQTPGVEIEKSKGSPEGGEYHEGDVVNCGVWTVKLAELYIERGRMPILADLHPDGASFDIHEERNRQKPLMDSHLEEVIVLEGRFTQGAEQDRAAPSTRAPVPS